MSDTYTDSSGQVYTSSGPSGSAKALADKMSSSSGSGSGSSGGGATSLAPNPNKVGSAEWWAYEETARDTAARMNTAEHPMDPNSPEYITYAKTGTGSVINSSYVYGGPGGTVLPATKDAINPYEFGSFGWNAFNETQKKMIAGTETLPSISNKVVEEENKRNEIKVEPTYSVVTPETFVHTAYTAPSDIGDKGTQRIMNETGASQIQALKIQADATNNLSEKRYYENEIDRALQNTLVLSSIYHSRAKQSGLPTALNPYEYAADLSLSAMGNVGKGGDKVPTMPELDAITKAIATGEVGPYNSENLKSYSSTYGVIPLSEQQKIAASARGEGVNYDILYTIPQAGNFGYGTGKYVSSSYISEQLAKKSPIPAAVVDITNVKKDYVIKDDKFMGTTGTAALGTSLYAQDAELKKMTIGNVNAEGVWIGSYEGYLRYTNAYNKLDAEAKIYETTLTQEYARYKSDPLAGLTLTPIPRSELFGTKESVKSVNIFDKSADIAGGYVRAVGGITEPFGFNIVDIAASIPFANSPLMPFGPAIYLAARPGAQATTSTNPMTYGEPLPYGAWSESSKYVGEKYVAPVLGSANWNAGRANEYAKLGDTTPGLVNKIQLYGYSAGSYGREYLVRDPGAVPVLATQAALLEVTGTLALPGKIGSYIATSGTVTKYPLVQKGIMIAGKYGVDVAFGVGAAGVATQDNEGKWFQTIKPAQVSKNIGPLGVQAIAFGGGMYGAGKLKGGGYGTTVSEGKPFTDSTGRTSYGEGGTFEGKQPSGGTYRETKGKFDTNPSTGREFTQAEQTLDLLKKEVKTYRASGEEGLAMEAEGRIKAMERKMAKGQTEFGGGSGAFEMQAPAPEAYTYVDKSNIGKPVKYADASGSAEFLKQYESSIKVETPKVDIPKVEIIKPIEAPPATKSYVSDVYKPTNLKSYYETKLTQVKPRIETGKPTSLSTDVLKGSKLDLYATKGSGLSKYSLSPKDLQVYKGGEKGLDLTKQKTTDLDIYKAQPKELMKYKRGRTDIVEFKGGRTDITTFKPVKTDITVFKPPKTDIVPFKAAKTDIVKYVRPRTDIVEYVRPKTDLTVFKRPVTDVTVFKRGTTDIVKIEPVKFVRDEIRIDPKIEPIIGGGGLINLGNIGAMGGGSAFTGRRGSRGFQESFNYGFGVQAEDISLFKLPKRRLK